MQFFETFVALVCQQRAFSLALAALRILVFIFRGWQFCPLCNFIIERTIILVLICKYNTVLGIIFFLLLSFNLIKHHFIYHFLTEAFLASGVILIGDKYFINCFITPLTYYSMSDCFEYIAVSSLALLYQLIVQTNIIKVIKLF